MKLVVLLLGSVLTLSFLARGDEIDSRKVNVSNEVEVVPRTKQTKELKQPLEEKIVINVHADGAVVVEGEKLSLDQLLVRLQSITQRHKDRAITLRADEKAEYRKIMEVLDACQKARLW